MDEKEKKLTQKFSPEEAPLAAVDEKIDEASQEIVDALAEAEGVDAEIDIVSAAYQPK